MTALIRTTAPATEPLSLSEARLHLRLSTTDDDTLVTNLISVARMACEEFTRRALITQGWTLWLDHFPGTATNWWDNENSSSSSYLTVKRFINLPRPPLVAVASVSTFDDDDTETVFDPANYFVDSASEPGRLALRNAATWPTPGRETHGIQIVYTAGYGDASDVPQSLKQGMLGHIAALYENRGDDITPAAQAMRIKVLPAIVEQLYQPYRLQHLVLP